MRQRIFVVCIAILLLTTTFLGRLPVQAQDDDEAPGLIVSTRVRPILPYGVRFLVRVDSPPEEVEEIRLTIEQHSEDEDLLLREQRLLDLDESLFINFRDEAEYQYIWQVQETEQVYLFTSLTYKFEVLLTSGQTTEQEETLILTHQGYDGWQQTQSEDITLYWYREGIQGDFMAIQLETPRSLIEEHTGESPPDGFVIYMEADVEDPSFCTEVTLPAEIGEEETTAYRILDLDQEFPCEPGQMADLYLQQNLIPVIVPGAAFRIVEDALVSEMVETVYTQRWEGVEVPAWFQYGIQNIYQTTGNATALDTALNAFQQDTLLRLDQMTDRPAEQATISERQLWEAQAYLLTVYLAERGGADAPFTIATAIGPETPFEDGLENTIGESLQNLYRQWAAWLGTQDARLAVAWNPYLDPTPTLTVTPSPTATIPTATPTSTITPSITPTPGNTPVQRITLIPTDTPRAISPPTATPLPPGSLSRPTSVPPTGKTQEEQDEDNGLCGSGLGALIFPLFALLMRWQWQRRRDAS